MKIVLSLILIISLYGIQAQTTIESNNSVLFAQCLFSIESQDEMLALEQDMRNNPYVSVVRLDWHTQRAFILTKNIDALSNADLVSWFGSFANTITCIQIGTYGTDKVNPYPFTNCKD